MLAKMKIPQTTQDLTFEEQLQNSVNRYNEREGKLTGYDCRICKNKGYIAKLKGTEEVFTVCNCMEHRKYLKQLRQSGLEDAIQNYTFDDYIISNGWQQKLKNMCLDFLDNSKHEWLFFGGQSGCGKTHLCTALCGEFLKKGVSVAYMMWRDDSTDLKQSIVKNPQHYESKMEKYKSVSVLYIDDLFKCGKSKEDVIAVTASDINLAFEILNYRAFKGMQTIISSELIIDEFRRIDEAIAGRIYERSMAKNYGISIAYDESKNYRFGGNNG